MYDYALPVSELTLYRLRLFDTHWAHLQILMLSLVEERFRKDPDLKLLIEIQVESMAGYMKCAEC